MQRNRGFEPSSAPSRRDSAGLWTSSGPNSLLLDAKHYTAKKEGGVEKNKAALYGMNAQVLNGL